MHTLSVFSDQEELMLAAEQTVGIHNPPQVAMYKGLVDEEYGELCKAIGNGDTVEVVDGALDLIVVCIGLLHSISPNAQELWNEVHQSNMAKLGPDGRFIRNADGRIIKPEGWQPPAILRILKAQGVL